LTALAADIKVRAVQEKNHMRFNSFLAAVAAAAWAAAPVVAAPKRAATTEVAPQSETVEGEQLRRGFLLPLAIIIAIIIGVLLLTDDDEDVQISP
jgi:Na+/H+ antiporter NhaC